MGEAANVRTVRVQYLALDDSAAKLRDVRLQEVEEAASPAGIRRTLTQSLLIATDPANLRDVRAQFVENAQSPAGIRRATGMALLIDQSPANLRDVRAQFVENVEQPLGIRRLNAQILVVDKAPINLRDVRTQLVEDAPLPASMRRLSGQFLYRERFPANVKAARLQYMEIDNSHPDLRLQAWPELLKLINQNNGFTFTTDQLIPGTPEVSTEPNLWNTKLLVTARPSSGFSGSMYVHYQRYAIAAPFGEVGHPFLNLTGKVSVKDILPEINAWFLMNLTLDDVYDHPIVDGKKFLLEVKEGSWFYLPGSKYTFYNVPDLATLYPNTELDGFEGPLRVGDIQVAPGQPSGVYKMMGDNNVLHNVYVNMDVDGGGWILVADWNAGSSDPNLLVTFDESIVKDKPMAGWSVDAAKPAITAGKFAKNPFSEWMLTSEHPTWKTYFGDWSIGQLFSGTAGIPVSGFPVKTSIGNKTMYGSRAGWNEVTTYNYGLGFWTHGNNSGPCGGANVVGSNRCCPVLDAGGSGSHADYTYKKRMYVRARNFVK